MIPLPPPKKKDAAGTRESFAENTGKLNTTDEVPNLANKLDTWPASGSPPPLPSPFNNL